MPPWMMPYRAEKVMAVRDRKPDGKTARTPLSDGSAGRFLTFSILSAGSDDGQIPSAAIRLALSCTPTVRAASSPFLNTIRQGMLLMP